MWDGRKSPVAICILISFCAAGHNTQAKDAAFNAAPNGDDVKAASVLVVVLLNPLQTLQLPPPRCGHLVPAQQRKYTAGDLIRIQTEIM